MSKYWLTPSRTVILFVIFVAFGVSVEETGIQDTTYYLLSFTLLFAWYRYLIKRN